MAILCAVRANAAFGRSAHDIVLNSIAGEDRCRAVVHLDREVAGELSLDLAQDASALRLEVEDLGGGVELVQRGAPPVGLLGLGRLRRQLHICDRRHVFNLLLRPTGRFTCSPNPAHPRQQTIGSR